MKISYKRTAICYFLIIVLLFICTFRVFSVMNKGKYKQVAEQTSRRVISLDFSRGTIFDANMSPITNANEMYYTIIFDETDSASALYNHFSGDEIERIIKDIKQNGFALRKTSKEINSNGIYCIKGYSHADDSLLAKHIIGYVSSEGEGLCGLELGMNDKLFCGDKNQIIFTIDGQGKVINGYEPELKINHEVQNSGIQITLDSQLQQIAEQKAMQINCGAVIITDIETGKIRAMVSRPDYKLSNLASAINDENEPMLNRALCTYNIGSVFKPMVAAVGYEMSKKMTTDCTGYTNVDGLSFACHKLGGHGTVDLSDALKYSCNSFFYNFIQIINTDKLFAMAQKAGFDSRVYLTENIVGAKGNLGETNSNILTKRSLANLSIGQGELMTSPLALTNLYMAIARDGTYIPQSLIEGEIENLKSTGEKTSPKSIRLFSKATADKLKQDLSTVLDEDGTGKSAKPTLVSAAGKTGTAQTGVLKGGRKVTNSWFCGFFPLENPKYAVTILSENAKGGCGIVFAQIADAVTEYELQAGGN